MSATEKTSMITTKVYVPPEAVHRFADWQAKLNTVITAFPGFVSLEILFLKEQPRPIWTVVQRFNNNESTLDWRNSKQYKQLLEELKNLTANGDPTSVQVQELDSDVSHLQEGVTEVFVTEVSPDKVAAYREWISKIHQVEATFPGFRGMYVQSPNQGRRHWITFLQFDKPENLDRWISSPERQKILQESKSLIASLENHRIISPYAGWFSAAIQEGKVPPVWKQTMIILLVLFPIVMLELKYLSPLTAGLNSALATFISNAISVTLLAWPMLPIAISLLNWWLSPKEGEEQRITILGTILLLTLYVLEVVIFSVY